MYLLAFDLSSTVCGICIINLETKKIVSLSFYKFTSTNMLDKSTELRDLVYKYATDLKITVFVIEEKLKSFRAGGTNAESMLNKTNYNQYLKN